MLMTRSSTRLRAAAAAVVALGTLGTLGISSTALADASTSTIDDSATTTLTIHKYSGPANSTADCNKNDGQAVDASCLTGKTALSGATFTVYKVMDLKTNADWQTAEETYKAGAASYTPTGTGTAVTTDTSGTATFTGGVALYYVKETTTPTGYTGSAPFFITLPMTDPSDGAWDYSLDVYPKNDKQSTVHKDVKDNTGAANQTALTVGQTLTYDVTTNVPNYGDVVGPANAAGAYTAPDGVMDYNDLPSFYVDDYFSSNLSTMAVTGVTLGGTALSSGDYGVLTNGQTVRVYLTKSGLTKAAASNGAALKITYTAKVATVPGSGEIANRAYANPGDKPSAGTTPSNPPATPPSTPPTTPPDTPGTPSNQVVSKFGKIRINKVGSDTNNALSGATFAAYNAKVTYGADGKTISSLSCDRSDLTGTPVSTFTTDSSGNGVSDFLLLNNWYNDAVEETSAGSGTYLTGGEYAKKYGNTAYCLVETKAPSGYQLLADPLKITLTTEGDTTGVTYDYTQVKDQPDNLLNKLPLTGGEGIGILSIAGIALVGGGVGYYAYTQRKRREDA